MRPAASTRITAITMSTICGVTSTVSPKNRGIIARNSSAGMPASCGGANASRASAHDAKPSRIAFMPPSISTTPDTLDGFRAATSSATIAPHEWPIRTGRLRRVDLSTATASATVWSNP